MIQDSVESHRWALIIILIFLGHDLFLSQVCEDTYVANGWACKFEKLKWVLTYADACVYFYFYSIQLSEMCSKVFDRLLRALIGFDWNSILRWSLRVLCFTSHSLISDRCYGNLDTILIQPSIRCILRRVFPVFFIFIIFVFLKLAFL